MPNIQDPWLSDIQELAAKIPLNHINAFKWTSQLQFEEAVYRISSELRHLDEDIKAVKLAELVEENKSATFVPINLAIGNSSMR